VHVLKHLGELIRTAIKSSLSVYVVKNLVHDDGQATESRESRDTISRASRKVIAALGAICEWCPVLMLFELVEKGHGYAGIGFLEADRSTLVEALDFINH
jgi:hypothetical protein